MFFNHWSQIPNGVWRWRSFEPREIATPNNGSILINFEFLDKLQAARDIVGKPFHMNSVYRDDEHNAMVGGSPRSVHLECGAGDISLVNHNKSRLVAICKRVGFTGFGLSYSTFVHVDIGRKRSW